MKIIQNSKNLQVGDRVYHERGYFGTVREVNYNDADEVEVDWEGSQLFLGKETKISEIAASRTSVVYLTKVN